MRAVLVATALLPALTAAQARISAVEEEGGTVLGRVCRDLDGDGACGEGEPGIAGARILLDGGQVAIADSDGRYHLLNVPGRIAEPGRSAYGGHIVALESAPGEPRLRRSFELAPGGAVRVDLAVPAPREVAAVPLRPADRAAPEAPRLEAAALVWILSGRAPPGSSMEVDGKPARVEPDGTWFAAVRLHPHANGFGLAVAEPDGRLSLHHQVIHWAPRQEGGDLVVPEPPVLLATVALPRGGEARGRDLVLRGVVAEGVRLAIAGEPVRPSPSGAFETAVPFPTGEGTLSVEARQDGRASSASPRIRFERIGGALAAIADLELSAGPSGTRLAGRGAVAGRGVLGPFEGAAGVDLDDRDRSLSDLLRPRDPLAAEHQLSPARSVPTAGDDAAADDANAPRGRIYAHVTAPGGRLDLGAYRPGLTGQELGRYDRSLFGGKIQGRGDAGPVWLEGTFFGAVLEGDSGQTGPPVPAHDVLPATGGSLYYLSHGEVVAGSEALRVEWRDRLTALAVDQRALVRGADYEIDYLSGRVLLARPLASAAGPASVTTGDPLSAAQATLLADYSHAAQAGREDVAGGRAAAGIGPFRIQGAYASEDRAGPGYSLASASAALDLGTPFLLRAEAARSRGAAFAQAGAGFSGSSDGGVVHAGPDPAALPQGDRDAWHLEGHGEAGGARYAAWWRERPRGYSDSSHLETQDALERGASARWAGGGVEVSALYAEVHGADPRDPAGLGALAQREVRGRAAYALSDVTFTAEALGSEATASGQDGSQTSAGIRADWRTSPGLTLGAAYHQSLARQGSGPAAVDSTYGGLDARLSGKEGSLSAQAGWGPGLGPRLLVGGERSGPGELTYGTFSVDPDAPSLVRESVSAFGVRRTEGSAEIFSEEQFARDALGIRASRVSGVALEVLPGLRLSARAEAGDRLLLDGSTASRRALGGTAAWIGRALRLAGRGEVREDGGLRQTVAGATAEWRATERLRLSGLGTWTRTLGDPSASSLDAVVGCAWRGEKVLLLAKVAAVSDRRPGGAARDAGLASLAATLDISRAVAVGLGASYGANRFAGARQDLAAGSVRATVRIAGPLDAAAEYARRQLLRGTSPGWLDAGRLEAGWALGGGRLALGYNLFGFSGTGVDPAGDDRGRAYLRAELVY